MDPQFTDRSPKSSPPWHRAIQKPIPFSFQHSQVPLLQPTQIAHHLTIISHTHLLWDFIGKIPWVYNSSFTIQLLQILIMLQESAPGLPNNAWYSTPCNSHATGIKLCTKILNCNKKTSLNSRSYMEKWCDVWLWETIREANLLSNEVKSPR